MAVEKQTNEPLVLDDVYTFLRAEVGSRVHGTNVEGTDDRDEMGVCIEPPEWVVGLRHFEQFVIRDQPQGVRSQPGDLDLVVYGLRKFASLALKGNPSILLLFMVPDETCNTLHPLGRALRANVDLFASRKAGSAFLGYMQQQRERLMGERGQMNVKRPELVEAYGFDTKYAGHMLRLGFQGIEYMQTGRFTVPMSPLQRDEILAVRTGKRTKSEVLDAAQFLENVLKVSIAKSELPPEPDYTSVNRFLVDAYWEEWSA